MGWEIRVIEWKEKSRDLYPPRATFRLLLHSMHERDRWWERTFWATQPFVYYPGIFSFNTCVFRLKEIFHKSRGVKKTRAVKSEFRLMHIKRGLHAENVNKRVASSLLQPTTTNFELWSQLFARRPFVAAMKFSSVGRRRRSERQDEFFSFNPRRFFNEVT